MNYLFERAQLLMRAQASDLTGRNTLSSATSATIQAAEPPATVRPLPKRPVYDACALKQVNGAGDNVSHLRIMS